MAKKLSAPAKSPKGGTGGMRVNKAGTNAADMFGPKVSAAPGPAELAHSETYGEHGKECNGSESDAGLMNRGREDREHDGRGFGSTLMKNVTK